MPERVDEATILAREAALRTWLTRGRDPVDQVIDGFDVGWGGVQRWATARMPKIGSGRHLDFACGVGTFLAELGWRHPKGEFVGLNIDFVGPHAPARELLARAGVRSDFVCGDARRMPFADGAFDSASCFLGLQDIEIGFRADGVRAAVSEATRVLRRNAALTLLDAYTLRRFKTFLEGCPVRIARGFERTLDVRWNRPVAERALEAYAAGWVDQMRLSSRKDREQRRAEVLRSMHADLERQMAAKGFFVPFPPVRMIIARKD